MIALFKESKKESRAGGGSARGGKESGAIWKKEISSRILQAELFRRLIIVPLQSFIYREIIPCLFCKINANKR